MAILTNAKLPDTMECEILLRIEIRTTIYKSQSSDLVAKR